MRSWASEVWRGGKRGWVTGKIRWQNVRMNLDLDVRAFSDCD
jgi:hypothetical protein